MSIHNLKLTDDLSAIRSVVDEARTASNAIYTYIDSLNYIDDKQISPDSREELKGARRFTVEDEEAIWALSRTISRLCLIIEDSLMEVYNVLCDFKSPDKEQLKSVVFDKLYRGL